MWIRYWGFRFVMTIKHNTLRHTNIDMTLKTLIYKAYITYMVNQKKVASNNQTTCSGTFHVVLLNLSHGSFITNQNLSLTHIGYFLSESGINNCYPDYSPSERLGCSCYYCNEIIFGLPFFLDHPVYSCSITIRNVIDDIIFVIFC
jgi:hypothetical protein